MVKPIQSPARDVMLRAAMVDELRSFGAIRSERVAEAVRVVPRHLFVPDEPLERAYEADSAVVVKRDEDGTAVSLLSSAHIQATMLEQAGVEPGMRVLEVGSGGYNSALLAELAGPAGRVTSIDIDPDIVARARACLAAAGYGRVRVEVADAERGLPDGAPYDRVVVTAGAWDLPPAWTAQLAEGGRIVVPLRMRGLTRCIAFERDRSRLVSRGYRLCGFVAMRGAGAHSGHWLALDADEVGLRVDDQEPPDAAGLRASLFTPAVTAWSGVVFDQVDEMDLWMATMTRQFGLLTATPAAAARGVVTRSATRGAPTAVSGSSFAYLTKRRVDGTDGFETGVQAHGPAARDLAAECTDLLRTWDRGYRYGQAARIEVHPVAAPAADLPRGLVLRKKHTHVVISWPGNQTASTPMEVDNDEHPN